jgi:hypothetical protein
MQSRSALSKNSHSNTRNRSGIMTPADEQEFRIKQICSRVATAEPIQGDFRQLGNQSSGDISNHDLLMNSKEILTSDFNRPLPETV